LGEISSYCACDLKTSAEAPTEKTTAR
jgi:hypothetical protein